MSENKIVKQRWYCTLRDGGESADYWSLKKANEEPIGEFATQNEAVEKFTSLNITATLWFQVAGKYVRTIKSLQSFGSREQVIVDSDMTEEVRLENEKRRKEFEKEWKEHLKREEEAATAAQTVVVEEPTVVEPVVVVEPTPVVVTPATTESTTCCEEECSLKERIEIIEAELATKRYKWLRILLILATILMVVLIILLIIALVRPELLK